MDSQKEQMKGKDNNNGKSPPDFPPTKVPTKYRISTTLSSISMSFTHKDGDSKSLAGVGRLREALVAAFRLFPKQQDRQLSGEGWLQEIKTVRIKYGLIVGKATYVVEIKD